MVDARGALDEGQEAVRAIADAVEANAAALLVLLSRNDAAALDAFHQHGATHFLVSPFTEPQLLHAFQFARRHAERVGGGGARRARRGRARPPRWRWQPGSRTVELSPALARQAGLGEEDGRRISLMELFRKLDPDGRRAARERDRPAARHRRGDRLRPWRRAGDGRIAHHVRVAGEGEIVGRAETDPGSGGCQGRDPLTGLRDGRAARAWIAEQLAGGEGERRRSPCSLSVSRYDAINAAFGRATGDAVLQAAARRIERQVEADGRAPSWSRAWPGAEFAVLLAGAGDARRRPLPRRRAGRGDRPAVRLGRPCHHPGRRAGVAAAEAGDDAAAPAAPRQRRSGRGQGRRQRAGPRARGRRRKRHRARRPARGRSAARARPGRDRDPLPAAGLGRPPARSSAPRRSPAGTTRNMASSARSTLFSVAEGSDYLVQLSDHVQRKAIGAAAAWPDGARRACASRSTSPPPTSLRPGLRRLVPGAGAGKRLRVRRGSPSRSPKAA